jgi:head-tail adaptor
MNAEMRRHALRRYLVFRVKVIEFFDLAALRQGFIAQQFTVPTPVGRISSDFVDSLRTIQLSWFALLVDKSKDGMNAITLWCELFPKEKGQIQEAWSRIDATWNIIRAFRDKAGFHADKPLAFFKARNSIVAQQREITAAIEEFQKLLRVILKAEVEVLPDLEEALDDLLDDLETELGTRYNRTEFKRYLMIPNTGTERGPFLTH